MTKETDTHLPPFYKALKKYAQTKKALWSSPGHSSGDALLKSKEGRDFREFFGRNIFEADISSSVIEMGSILEHEGPAAEAEREAADTFGADTTFFVLNGTSTANKVVFFTTVAPGDVVLVGRNCHKSIMHAIVMNEALPIYLKPKNNIYGLIGPVPFEEFSKESIKDKINKSKIITNKKAGKVQLTVLTNSTYDGFLYNADKIRSKMANSTHYMHFDEAWFPYGAFHTFYDKRYALSPYIKKRGVHVPPVFVTQSTHKMLFAFSQASMLHFKRGTDMCQLDLQGLIEANLMHASTSPFYPMFASLDISSRIMRRHGYQLISSCLEEALRFRASVAKTERTYRQRGDWYFSIYQPSYKNLNNNPEQWRLLENQNWHGFDIKEQDDILLDPLKVTVLTPGIKQDGSMAGFGIPAAVLSKFLRAKGIVPEKTGFYNILFLFSPGITPAKSRALKRALNEFKVLYDANAPLFDIFPDLMGYGECYPKNAGLRDLCEQMHSFLMRHNVLEAITNLYSDLPEQVMAPHKAYYALVEGKTEYLRLEQAAGRVCVFMILPYPPGIPLVMPGEAMPAMGSNMMRFLKMSELFDFIFRGFETEFHGIKKIWEDGRPVYLVNCIKLKTTTKQQTTIK